MHDARHERLRKPRPCRFSDHEELEACFSRELANRASDISDSRVTTVVPREIASCTFLAQLAVLLGADVLGILSSLPYVHGEPACSCVRRFPMLSERTGGRSRDRRGTATARRTSALVSDAPFAPEKSRSGVAPARDSISARCSGRLPATASFSFLPVSGSPEVCVLANTRPAISTD